MSGDPSYSSATSPQPERIIAGEFPRVTRDVTIASGQNLSRGAVVGRVTASGEYVLCDTGAADGSEDPRAILVNDIDASAGAKEGAIYETGEFNEDELTYGGTDTADDVRDALRDRGIFLKTTTAA